MKLSHWNSILSLRIDIHRLLERSLSVESTRFGERSAALPIEPSILQRLHGELRSKLDTLRDQLHRELTENETYLVMFPLVLLCDEMVMIRLPKAQQTSWPLLQSELFQINYGGDVFYDFVDERLDKPDTPSMVFEVLYFCLAAGFVGKFGESGGKVQRYRTLLAEQLGTGSIRDGSRKRRRRSHRVRSERRSAGSKASVQTDRPIEAAQSPEQSPQAVTPLRKRVNWRGLIPYGVALTTLSLAALAIIVLSNL